MARKKAAGNKARKRRVKAKTLAALAPDQIEQSILVLRGQKVLLVE